MIKQASLVFAVAILAAGCSATSVYSGAVDEARRAGRPVVIWKIPSQIIFEGSYYHPKDIRVAFINTTSQPLRSVTFYFVPYRHNGRGPPVHGAAKKGFTAKGPFAPNHSYKYRRVEHQGHRASWPDVQGFFCPVLIGMSIRKADDSTVHVGKRLIERYLTSNVYNRCGS